MNKTFQTGGDRNLGYLIADDVTRKAVVIDPSYDPIAIVTFASNNNYDVIYAFNTHDHHDHTNGNEAFEAATGVHPLKFGDAHLQLPSREANSRCQGHLRQDFRGHR